jgi:transposase, IS5 family
MLILKHLYQWSDIELEGRVKDSLVLRWFCRVACHGVPDGSTRLPLAADAAPPNATRASMIAW